MSEPPSEGRRFESHSPALQTWFLSIILNSSITRTLAVNPSLNSNPVGCIQTNEISSYIDLEKKIDSITKSLSKHYYISILRNLVKNNPNKDNKIYDYIIAEQTELNIRNSTIEGKLKVLV